MASVVGDFICATRNLLSQGFRSLPVILGGSSLILGMTQGNFNFLFFFVGMFILAPTGALFLNILWELIFSNTPWWFTVPKHLWLLETATAEACALYTIGNPIDKAPETLNVVPTYWMTMIAFFFNYLFFNAYSLYGKQETSKASPVAVAARKSQSFISMVLLVGVGIVFTIMRYATSCETGLGLLVGWILGGSLSYGWYKFMKQCGLGRLDDLFGISNRILPLQSYQELDPTVCVPNYGTDEE
jgi:hypothetical protein